MPFYESNNTLCETQQMPSMSTRSPYFSIQSINASIYHLDFLHSRAIVLNNNDFSFTILHPDTQLAFDILEEGIGTFDLHQPFETSEMFQGTVFENYCKKSHLKKELRLNFPPKN